MVKNIKMQDIAKLAGVSTATVSRALSGNPLVGEGTRRKVFDLAREKGYFIRPHMLSSFETHAEKINIVVPLPQARQGWMSDPFFLELLGAIGQAAQNNKCSFVVSHIVPHHMDDLLQLVNDSSCVGTVFLGQSDLHERLNQLASFNRFIVWGADVEQQRYCSVGTDNVMGGRRATRHLLRLGRKHIAFLGDIEAPEIRQRFLGYKEALAEQNIEFDKSLVFPFPFEVEGAESVVKSSFVGRDDIDGVFAASDTIAIGVIRGLKALGRDVPEDLSVVGYDDIYMARYNSPALTTIRQDFETAGRLIVSKLLHQAEDRMMISERLATNVIIRESCGA